MPSKKKSIKKTIRKSSLQNKGFSAFFLVVVVAISIFLAGAFEANQTPNPTQVIPDPNQSFANPTGKDSLQLKTINFITTSPTMAAPAPALCQNGGANSEPQILVGYSPAAGESVSATGQIKVWINDEGAPIIAPGEVLDPNTGVTTTQGDRTATSPDGYLWEPALYISPQTAESGGTPHFPTAIKGDYNNTTNKRAVGLHVNGMDPVPPGKPLNEQYTAEDIWDVASLGLTPGTYTAEFAIHDGDVDRGVGCVAITIQ